MPGKDMTVQGCEHVHVNVQSEGCQQEINNYYGPVLQIKPYESSSDSESGVFSGGSSKRFRLNDSEEKDVHSESQGVSRYCSKGTGQALRRRRASQHGALNATVEAIRNLFGLSQLEELATSASEKGSPDCNCQVTPEIMSCGDTERLKITCPLIAAADKYSLVGRWKKQQTPYSFVEVGEVLPEDSGGTSAVYATVSAPHDSTHVGFASLQLLPSRPDAVKHKSVEFFFTKRLYVPGKKQDQNSSNDDNDGDNDGYDCGPSNSRSSGGSLRGDATRSHSSRSSTSSRGNNSSSGSSNSGGRQSCCYPTDLMQQYLTAEFLAYRLIQREESLPVAMIEDSICGDSMKQWLDCDKSMKSARNRVSSIYGLAKCPVALQYVICEKLLILCAGMACSHVSHYVECEKERSASDDKVHVLTLLDSTTESISEVSNYEVSAEQSTSQSDCEHQKTDSRCLYDQQTALQLLRSRRRQLIDRLSPRMVRALLDTLCEQHIMSTNEMEDIQSERTREEMARRLLFVIETRSWEECVEFAPLLSQTEGIKDLGKKLLENADLPKLRSRLSQSSTAEKEKAERTEGKAELSQRRTDSVRRNLENDSDDADEAVVKRKRVRREQNNARSKATEEETRKTEASRNAATATPKLYRYQQKEKKKRQKEMERVREKIRTGQSAEVIRKRMGEGRPSPLKPFGGQTVILTGKTGSGKSSLVNYLNSIVADYDSDSPKCTFVSETSAATMQGTKTILLLDFGPDNPGKYRSVTVVAERSKAPSFIDICEILSKSDVKEQIYRALAEFKMDTGTCFHPLIQLRLRNLEVVEIRQELALWNITFPMSASEAFPSRLTAKVYQTLSKRKKDCLDIRFTLIFKANEKGEDQRRGTQVLDQITRDAKESLDVERSRIFPIVTFLSKDRDDSFEIILVPHKQKMLIDALIKILVLIAEPD